MLLPMQTSCGACPQRSHRQGQRVIHEIAIAHIQDVVLLSKAGIAMMRPPRREGVGSLCRRITPLQSSEAARCAQRQTAVARMQWHAAYLDQLVPGSATNTCNKRRDR